MKLTDKEQEMLVGKAGPAVKWAMEHQLQVGRMFDAEEMVTVSQAHMMADPESLGESGVQFAEKMAKDGARVCIPMITDPRGVDPLVTSRSVRPNKWLTSSAVSSQPVRLWAS